MATEVLLIHPDPTGDDQPLFAGQRHAYTNGGCGLLAVGLSRITGWPMVACNTPTNLFAHMGVQAPDGKVWDARGPHTNTESFITPFGTDAPEHGLRVTTPEELFAYAPMLKVKDFIAAERIASMMFPHLPHLLSSDRERNVAFMNDVEALSRRHNIWLVACGQAMKFWPVIGEQFDGIAGYRAAHDNTHDITTFDRVLVSERGSGPTCLPERLERFIEKLEVISRQHELWIRAALPTTWPRLTELDEKNRSTAHYAIRQSDNAGGFLVNLA